MKYPLLFTSGKIGSLTIKNRIVMTAMEIDLGRFDGKVSSQLSDYFFERALGEVGLIITGIARVDSLTGVGSPRQLSVAHSGTIKSLKKLTDRIHTTDTKIFCQIHHPGRQSYSAMIGNWPLMAFASKLPGFQKVFGPLVALYQWGLKNFYEPSVVSVSNVMCHHVNQRVRALKKSEIKKIVGRFINAAERVKKAGFDGVELHGAHGYLIQQFLSPRTNLRQDEYGGSLENRMRFLKEIIEGIRLRCGNDFPLTVRLSVEEFYEEKSEGRRGIILQEGVQIAEILANWGVDALNISSATYETINQWLEPVTYEPGWRSYLAKAVKEKVDIPIIAANLIRSPEQAQKQIQEGVQDFVGMGRPFLCDPHWVKKVKEGREDQIISCIGCLHCFESLMKNAWKGLPLECARNPFLGKEKWTNNIIQDKKGEKLLVVGGGIAGLSAAYFATLRGYDVDLYEKGDVVGGQVLLAEKPQGKLTLGKCIQEELQRCRRAGVHIHLGTPINADEILSKAPNRVIIAVGSQSIIPPIPGIEGENCYTVDDILSEKVVPQGKKVLIIGSGLSGLETAAFLMEKGNRVVVVEQQKSLAPTAYSQNREDALKRLKEGEFYTSCQVEKIGKESVEVRHLESNRVEKIECDCVVVAVGNRSRSFLLPKKKGGPEVFYIGDALKIGKIADGVHSAFRAIFNF